MQGASPLASPGLGGTRHWGCLWKAGCGGGLAFFAACRLRLAGAQWGGVPSWSPAASAFSLLCCPHPPTPLPGGKGEILVFLCKGLRPLHPRGWVGCGTGFACGKRVVAVGLPFWLPAAPPLAYFAAPLPRRGRISPRPALAERSSPPGKGEIFSFLMQGASPLASPGLNPGGTG